MKTIFSFCAAVLFLLSFFTTQTLTSCTKETTIRDTTILHDTTVIRDTVNHFDTTIVYLHDTVQLTLESCCNENEGYVNSYYITDNANGVNQLTVAAWTHGGSPETSRSFLRFDYSDVPETSILISAKLSLYAMPTPGSGNMVDAHFGTANSFTIRRITSTISPTLYTWNNQPTSSNQNQVIIPQSTSSFQNNTGVDVTNLVKDMLAQGNNGFFMQLQNEITYNSRQYCSSFYIESSKRPKLVLQYKQQ
ncbi:MAG: DNRLRE domain-containing protein [Chitinophagaceae bacterium]